MICTLYLDDNKNNKNIFPLQRITLSSFSEEYQKVFNLFNKTLPCYYVQKVERVQNLGLWEVYQWYVKGLLSAG